MTKFSVALSKIATNLNMETAFTPTPLEEIKIETMDVNRPGLLLAGYDSHFEPSRIQILGNAEMGFLYNMPEENRRERFRDLFSLRPPTVVVTRGKEPFPEMLDIAKKYAVPVLTSAEATSSLMSGILSILSVELAPRITRHGVLVEVYGTGILMMGESGIGKSETAVELLKRGHRLVADDAVELRRVSNRTIVGQAPENIRHFIELRGIGIINVARVFGSGAVKASEKIDLVVEMEPWDKHKNYNRTGLENNTIDILGLNIPLTVIPVMPGRNLAIIMEIAAISNRQKKMGYNAAHELLSQLGLTDDISEGVHSFIV